MHLISPNTNHGALQHTLHSAGVVLLIWGGWGHRSLFGGGPDLWVALASGAGGLREMSSRNNDVRLFMTVITAPSTRWCCSTPIARAAADRSSSAGGHLPCCPARRCSVCVSGWLVHSWRQRRTCGRTPERTTDFTGRETQHITFQIQRWCPVVGRAAAGHRAGPPAPSCRHACSPPVKPTEAAGGSSAATASSAARPWSAGTAVPARRCAAASSPSTSSSTTSAGSRRSCRASWSCCCSSPWATSSSGSSARGPAGTRTTTAARSPPSSTGTRRRPRTPCWTGTRRAASGTSPPRTCRPTTRWNICPRTRRACRRCTGTDPTTTCCRRGATGAVRAGREPRDREPASRGGMSWRCQDRSTAQGHVGTLCDRPDWDNTAITFEYNQGNYLAEI